MVQTEFDQRYGSDDLGDNTVVLGGLSLQHIDE